MPTTHQRSTPEPFQDLYVIARKLFDSGPLRAPEPAQWHAFVGQLEQATRFATERADPDWGAPMSAERCLLWVREQIQRQKGRRPGLLLRHKIRRQLARVYLTAEQSEAEAKQNHTQEQINEYDTRDSTKRASTQRKSTMAVQDDSDECVSGISCRLKPKLLSLSDRAISNQAMSDPAGINAWLIQNQAA